MDIELTDLEEILLYLETTSLEPHNDYTSEFTYKDQKILYKYIKELQQENKKLKDNWNKLKEYIDKTKIKEFEKSYGKRYGKTFNQAEIIVCNMILNKMQELQGSDNK